MALSASTTTAALIALLLVLHGCSTQEIPNSDVDLVEFALNLEYLEAEFFTYGAFGGGVETLAPNLTMGGPPSIGGRRAFLTPLIRDIIAQFSLQEFGHLRAIQKTVKGFPRPLVDISVGSFATVMNNAFGVPLLPPFDPYANDINYLIASYVLPYVGLTGYVGSNPNLQTPTAKRLIAGLLGLESGQDAVIRTLLYERALLKVLPYPFTVAEFTNRISNLRNQLGKDGLKDEGLIVVPEVGADGRASCNVLAADQDSLSYGRTPEEILRIVYATGKENVPGGFFPRGANGRIATSYFQR
ncbi:Desiccation-related protein PCC13-62 [Sesamum alatum]|uniref:Desiccation-related protein PCC13-62 n=1 Tax=Sesamum alatum TaxID=300844 RepID=A0AAE1YQ42_9LAMI|nr:Desiccation-related protein PCC13-62 [Sesamum alatum]